MGDGSWELGEDEGERGEDVITTADSGQFLCISESPFDVTYIAVGY